MTDKLIIKDKEIVVPGDLLAEGLSYLPAGRAFRENNNIYASTTGLVHVKGKVVKVIPLAGAYTPEANDNVIGKIKDIRGKGWSVNIGGPFPADLNIAEASSSYIDLNRTSLNQIYAVGDYVLAKIKMITEQNFVKLSTRDRQYKKLTTGCIMSVSPTKIPRIIGKKGSMIALLTKNSGCEVFVGQNGLVWIDGPLKKVLLVKQAIEKIEQDSQKSGLTDAVEKLLKGGAQ